MHNGGGYWNQWPGGNNFYQQYLQQHAQLGHWLQEVHQYVHAPHQSPHRCPRHCCAVQHHSTHNGQRRCCTVTHLSDHNCRPHQCCATSYASHGCCVPPVPRDHTYQPTPCYPVMETGHPEAPYVPHGAGHPGVPHAPVRHACDEESSESDEDSSESEDSDDSNDEEGSEDELVCNVDAILALRATKDVSDRDSDDSFELLDSVADDMQEYVKMGAYGNLERRCGKLGEVNAREEELNRLGQLKEMYGERADAIGGMEALLSVQFNHLCDTLQPTLWPVLPILL